MAYIHIKQNLSHAVKLFNRNIARKFSLRLSKEEIASLVSMIKEMTAQQPEETEEDLEVIILGEVYTIVNNKQLNISTHATISLSCSQARTLFIWLNDFRFEHPLEERFSYTLVDKLHRQIC